MTEKDKNFLLKDLCARLPYGVMVHLVYDNNVSFERGMGIGSLHDIMFDNVVDAKPYLRPMSSITEEERDEIEEMSHGWFYVNEDGEIFPMGQFTDSGEFEDAILPTLEWLNKKMFDYRWLIPMGLALEASEGMYKTK